MQRFVIRRASPCDIPAILGIERAAHPGPWGEKAFADALDPAFPHSHLWVASFPEAGQVAGYISFHLLPGELYVINIAVCPQERSRGVATGLLDTCLRFGRMKGARRAILDVREENVQALGLYAKFGFRMAGKRSSAFLLELEL